MTEIAPVRHLVAVHASHGTGDVLVGVDLRVDVGERVAVIGANRSGKTTLARVLAARLEPTAGEVTGAGTCAVVESAVEASSTTVAAVVGGGERDTGSVHRALELVGLSAGLAHHALAEISGAERYLVGAAAALARRTDLLVVDEPAAVLDAASTRRLVAALGDHRGALVMFSTGLSLAAELCPRVVLLAGGRIVADGAASEILTDPELLGIHGVQLPAATSPSWLRRRSRRSLDSRTVSRNRLAANWASRPVDPERVAEEVAIRIEQAFVAFHTEFQGVTRRASRRFAQREWAEHQRDAHERLQLHRRCVESCVEAVRPLVSGFDERGRRAAWVEARHRFAQDIAWRSDSELAETFFNSVTRRVFTMVGTDDDLEFRWFGGIILPLVDPGQGEVATFRRRGTTAQLVEAVLRSFDLRGAWRDLERDAALVGHAIDRHLAETWESAMPVEVDMLRPVFYRNKGAYLVGRIRHLNRVSPLVLPLRSTEHGIVVDAVLLTENLTSRIFGFTRSYFHVDTEEPAAVIAFVKSLIPQKPAAELYTALGHNQHGKTQLFRGLYRHLQHSTDRFELARGVKGLVMTVFTLPSFDVVFKVIKDSFPPSKRTSRDQVMEKYRLVFAHDRVGRMVDAQAFENLSFPKNRFSDELLEELALTASRSVEIGATDVVIRHLYTERRVYPLDLYLQEMPDEVVRDAALDYGRAIKDLAAANIFPGDLFTKNFGVTRHGAVVFYDYDELAVLADCNFRTLPEARDYEDELSADPWFPVGVDDVFPQEFAKFFRLPASVRDEFHRVHGDLCDVDFWREMQSHHAAAEVPEFFPYPAEVRLPQP
jgi:isocitrate dehydrogenase kinase/phosphatase